MDLFYLCAHPRELRFHWGWAHTDPIEFVAAMGSNTWVGFGVILCGVGKGEGEGLGSGREMGREVEGNVKGMSAVHWGWAHSFIKHYNRKR